MNKETRLILRALHYIMWNQYQDNNKSVNELREEIKETLNPKQEDKAYEASL